MTAALFVRILIINVLAVRGEDATTSAPTFVTPAPTMTSMRGTAVVVDLNFSNAEDRATYDPLLPTSPFSYPPLLGADPPVLANDGTLSLTEDSIVEDLDPVKFTVPKSFFGTPGDHVKNVKRTASVPICDSCVLTVEATMRFEATNNHLIYDAFPSSLSPSVFDVVPGDPATDFRLGFVSLSVSDARGTGMILDVAMDNDEIFCIHERLIGGGPGGPPPTNPYVPQRASFFAFKHMKYRESPDEYHTVKVIYDKRGNGTATFVADGVAVHVDTLGVPDDPSFDVLSDRNAPPQGPEPVSIDMAAAGWNILNTLDYPDPKDPSSQIGICNLTTYSGLYVRPSDFLVEDCTDAQRLFGNSLRAEVKSFKMSIRDESLVST